MLIPMCSAYETALSLPSSIFAPSPYLKLSGIAVTLASVLEADGRPKDAWDVYVQALSLTQSPTPPTCPPPSTNEASSDREAPSATSLPQAERVDLTPQEVLRQVSIAHKLGQMAEAYSFGEAEEEKWLNWSVEKLLGIVNKYGVVLGGNSGAVEGKDSEVKALLADLELPGWVTKEDIAAPLEALGAFYARRGNIE